MTRAWCTRCRRAASMCWCAGTTPFRIGLPLTILIHPKEAKVAIGTARVVHNLVVQSELWIGDRFDDDPKMRARLADEALFPLILFPSPRALDLNTATPASLRAFVPEGKTPWLIVVDGTWTTAKTILRQSPGLMTLPAIRFTPDRPALYGRLRKEPRAECWSTLEAIHHVIDRFDALALVPAPAGRAHDQLLTTLAKIVDAQAAYEPPWHREATRGAR